MKGGLSLRWLVAPVRRQLNATSTGVRCFSSSSQEFGKLSAEQESRAKQRYADMKMRHFEVREQYPASSQGSQKIDKDIARRKRLIYRSKQRGLLEVDLLLAKWSEQHVDSLQEDELDQYEALLNQETIDIYNYITKKDSPPEELQTPILRQIQAFVQSSPLGRASPETFAKHKPAQ